jgi:glycosyltransferase involved in cell wall biosynthesis
LPLPAGGKNVQENKGHKRDNQSLYEIRDQRSGLLMPKVSVVVLTHNRPELLRHAVSSILNQTFQNFEIILVDDASTDNTPEVVSSFRDDRIRYIRHQVNKREAASRNTGVTNATGEYIAFLDDDDEWLPEKLDQQVRLLESSPVAVGAVYTGFLKIDRATKMPVEQVVPRKRGNIFAEMAAQNWVGTPSTVMVRRECFERVGLFDEGIPFGPDYDMWIRISKEYQIDYITGPLVNYFVHENSMSSNCQLMIRGFETQLAKYPQFFSSNKRSYGYRYLSLGVLYCYNGDIEKGRRALRKAIEIYPFEMRSYFNLGLSLLGSKAFRRLKERGSRHSPSKATT